MADQTATVEQKQADAQETDRAGALEAAYGSGEPWSEKIFLQVTGMKMWDY